MNLKSSVLFCYIFCMLAIICNGQNTKTNENKIISFKEGPQEVAIDETNKKIVFSVPGFVDITKIKPTIKVSDGATLSPASDTEQDFSKPFNYTVKASDGKIVSYTIIVSKRETIDGMPPKSGKPSEASMDTKKAQLPISLFFDLSKYEVQTQVFEGKPTKVRAFEKIVYVANPSDISQQIINIYIPEEYFNGGTINGYTAKTAPIFFPNKVGGYMPAQPASFINSPQSDGRGGPQSNAVQMALSKGLIVASAGARGRTSPIGKAPAGIVDLKAALRYLKFNDKTMPGDANKIISNGTSAGGAMSTLIGATGNHPDYESYLKAIGAANANDDIFAVSAYCPIINLENADMAYEWQLNKIQSFNFRGKTGNLDADALKVSEELKKAFPAYFNRLNLKNADKKHLKLNANGEGNFKELVKSYLVASAQKALESGTDLRKHGFMKIENGKVISVDFDGYMTYLERMKTPPAFDALNNSSPENQLFGTTTIDKRHFTGYALQKSTSDASTMADAQQIKMMNPMNYIGNKAANTSKYWRVRHGAKDKDTGFAVPIILAITLQNRGFNVDFALPWDKPHSGDYDLEDLFKWIDTICKK
jgi:hypothetical protein